MPIFWSIFSLNRLHWRTLLLTTVLRRLRPTHLRTLLFYPTLSKDSVLTLYQEVASPSKFLLNFSAFYPGTAYFSLTSAFSIKDLRTINLSPNCRSSTTARAEDSINTTTEMGRVYHYHNLKTLFSVSIF